jgi:molybdate transport system substrate-binding protein
MNKSTRLNVNSFNNLLDNNIKDIAIGTPESVPAGMYAKQTLAKLGLWEKLQPKMIQTKDVRQVLTYVETNNVDAGIVYMTDTKISDKVKVVSIADDQLHDPIVYPAGIIKKTKHPEDSKEFYQYLKSKPAKDIFKKYGFKALD